MQLSVTNTGSNAVRVIVNHDTVNDSTMQPGETKSISTPPNGVVEFRELGGVQGDLGGEAEHA